MRTQQTDAPEIKSPITLQKGQRVVYRRHAHPEEIDCGEARCEEGNLPHCCRGIEETNQCKGRCGMHLVVITRPRYGQSQLIVIEHERSHEKR